MLSSFMRIGAATVLSVLPLVTFEPNAEAQVTSLQGNFAEIRGRVENRDASEAMRVVLSESASGRLVDQDSVRGDGSFLLQGTMSAASRYRLEVRDEARVLHRQSVGLESALENLVVTIDKPTISMDATSTVSISRLLYAAPASAEKVFVKAMENADLDDSIELLEKAIELHPNYIEAHHNMAVRLSRKGDFGAAINHFQRALELDPSNAMAWANLGVTLDAQGDCAAAETAARQAITLSPRSEFASYLLGSLLLRTEKNLPYAAELLGNAASEFPAAGLLQIDALLASGNTAPARRALQSLVVASAGGVQ